MSTPTPLYHASLGGITGIVAQSPGLTLLFPAHTAEVLVVAPAAPLLLDRVVAEGMRGSVLLDIETRLRAQAGGMHDL
jgi:hypothetical protein